MGNEIFYKILGQFVRFALRGLSVVFIYVGVTPDDQTTFFEVSVGILTPSLILAITEGWSFLQKRFQQGMTETALLSPTSTSMADIKIETAKNVTGTSY